MKTEYKDGGIFLSEIKNFDPFVSCECGQCFRFEKISDDEYTLIAFGKKMDILRREGGYLFKNLDKSDENAVFDYFDLKRDYGAIIDSFTDETLIKAAKIGGGIRIFKQEPFEALISFIISQNNNIPRIKKIIAALCELYGEEKDGYFLFPTAEKIIEGGVEGLAPIRAGFRAKYIIDAAEKTLSGEIDEKIIGNLPYDDAREKLKTIKGVGDKVANCVLLFGYGMTEAFPIDVWVKKIIAKYYGDSFDARAFGKSAGIAQQYLFHYERNHGGTPV